MRTPEDPETHIKKKFIKSKRDYEEMREGDLSY